MLTRINIIHMWFNGQIEECLFIWVLLKPGHPHKYIRWFPVKYWLSSLKLHTFVSNYVFSRLNQLIQDSKAQLSVSFCWWQQLFHSSTEGIRGQHLSTESHSSGPNLKGKYLFFNSFSYMWHHKVIYRVRD